MASSPSSQPDITMLLDLDGVIRQAMISTAMAGENVDTWLGRSWVDSKTDLVYQNLLAPVVENAQLAALEITYGVETGRIAEMLESVRNSTLRTSEVLEQLIWHTSRAGGKDA